MLHRLLILTFIVIFILPTISYSNCEVAPYGFHTIAEYGTENEDGDFLVAYQKENNDLVISGQNTSYIYDFELKSNLFKVKIKHRDSILEIPDNKRTLITYYVGRENELTIPKTVFDVSKIPSQGYGRYVKETHTLWLSDQIEISRAVSSSYDDVILKDIYEKKIILDKKSIIPITKANILDVKYDITTIGKSLNVLKVIIVNLKLKDLNKLFPSARPSRFEGRTADFSLVYFQKANEPVFYVGDGRDEKCASSRLDMKANGKASDLGSIYKFDVTGAFDVTSDGVVDIIEINKGITYYLEPSGDLLVIQAPTGC